MDINDFECLTDLINKESDKLLLIPEPSPLGAPDRRTQKSQRRELTLADKVEFIKFYESASDTLSIRAVAHKFNIGKTAALGILKRKDEYLKQYSLNVDSNRRRIRRLSKFHEVNSCTWKWFTLARCRQKCVTGPKLQEKALRFATLLGLSGFKASNGWLDSFKKCYNIQQQVGKNAAEVVSCSANFDWKSKLPHLTSDHGLENVFCCKVSALCHRALPEKSMLNRINDNIQSVPAEERLIVLLCCGALGEKLQPWVIGKGTSEKSDMNQIVWKATVDGTLTREVFASFVDSLNAHFAKESRKILLFLDHIYSIDFFPAGEPQLSHITVHFFPINTVSHSHPMDLGILPFFKGQYRKRYLQRLQQGSTDGFHSDPTITESLELIKDAWDAVADTVVMKSYADAGFTLPRYIPPSSSVEVLYCELENLFPLIMASDHAGDILMSVGEYVNFDSFMIPMSATGSITSDPSEDEQEEQIAMEVMAERSTAPEELLSLNMETYEEELTYGAEVTPPTDNAETAAQLSVEGSAGGPGSDMTYEEAYDVVCKLKNFAVTKESCLLPLVNDLKEVIGNLILEKNMKAKV